MLKHRADNEDRAEAQDEVHDGLGEHRQQKPAHDDAGADNCDDDRPAADTEHAAVVIPGDTLPGFGQKDAQARGTRIELVHRGHLLAHKHLTDRVGDPVDQGIGDVIPVRLEVERKGRDRADFERHFDKFADWLIGLPTHHAQGIEQDIERS